VPGPLKIAVRVLCVVAAGLVPALATSDAPAVLPGQVAPYVPSMREDVQRMLDVGAVDAGDYVIDLGSGDGRIVIAAAQRGALAHGVEIDAQLVAAARQHAEDAGVDSRVTFIHGDIFAADIARATVVTLFLMPEANLRLRPKLLAELRPGTRVVSNSFDMGDWRPDRHIAGRSSGGLLLWVIPADIAGGWALSVDGLETDFTLDIEQQYQEIEVRLGPGALSVPEALLAGRQITFVAHDGAQRMPFHGTVDDDLMHGYVHVNEAGAPRVARWRAVRAR
jgi:SAM-dependent methyltransferase